MGSYKYTNLKQVADTLGVHVEKQIALKGFSVDTRTLKAGELFFALKGDRVDGHHFLEEAFSKGASAAIVSKEYSGPRFGFTLIPVEDPLLALQELSRKLIAHSQTKIVAVTGSLGKTTTKEFIAALLRTKYRVFVSPGNSNSQIGLPLSILNQYQGNEEILILEMGMTHPGNISRLVQIAPPEIAVMTTVAFVHAWNFISLEDIGWAKAEIFSHPKTRLGLFHYDVGHNQPWVSCGKTHKFSFSTVSPQADYYLNLQEENTLYSHLEKNCLKLPSLHLPGKHNVHNMLIACIVARHLNMDWDEIIQAIPLLKLPERRLEFIKCKGILFVNDSYNSAELSVKSALESLPIPQQGGQKIAVLGSMMELGPFSEDCHRRVGEFALKYVEKLFCLGEECQPMVEVWKRENKQTQLFLDRKELLMALKKELNPSDVVLLKGSRSKELWKILEEF